MPTAESPNVLVIDNDEMIVRAIITRLEPLGYNCISACTGAQGLAQFVDTPIDLVITDLNMPMLDGAFLLMEIRNVSNVPIIVVTGYENEYAESLANLPRVTVVNKPFHADDLIDLVELELADRKYRRAG